jgi:hypothetical protein
MPQIPVAPEAASADVPVSKRYCLGTAKKLCTSRAVFQHFSFLRRGNLRILAAMNRKEGRAND